MFRPHDGEDAEFGEVRIATENGLDAGIFVFGDAVFLDKLRRDGGVEHGFGIRRRDFGGHDFKKGLSGVCDVFDF